MSRSKYVLLFSIFSIGSALAWSGPKLPEPWKFEDLPVWDAGVRGGVPNIEVNRSISADELLGEDPAVFIQETIDSIEVPGAILLPEGSYTLKSPLRMRSGVVLRGMGSQKTHLAFDLNLPPVKYEFEALAKGSIQFEGQREPKEWPLSGDHAKGVDFLKIEDSVGLEVGNLIEVFSENDPHLLYTESRWKKGYARRALAQIVQIVRISPDGVFIDTPLRLRYFEELNPRIQKIVPIERSGLEAIGLERVDNFKDSAVGFENALNCWVLDCESYMAGRGHLWVNHSRFITVQGNEVHHAFGYDGGGQGYGIVAGNVAVDCLYIDNIAHNLRHSYMAKKGSNGNVFAFNYSFDRRRMPKGKKLLCDISLHGHYPYLNLFEGNVVQFVDMADHWGPTGPDTTFFRNRVTSDIKIRDHSHKMRLIGNVLVEGGIFPDVTVMNTTLLENQRLAKEGYEEPAHDEPLPASLYFDAKPSFWGELPWPSIGPGTDSSRPVFIPAQLRWQRKQH